MLEASGSSEEQREKRRQNLQTYLLTCPWLLRIKSYINTSQPNGEVCFLTKDQLAASRNKDFPASSTR